MEDLKPIIHFLYTYDKDSLQNYEMEFVCLNKKNKEIFKTKGEPILITQLHNFCIFLFKSDISKCQSQEKLDLKIRLIYNKTLFDCKIPNVSTIEPQFLFNIQFAKNGKYDPPKYLSLSIGKQYQSYLSLLQHHNTYVNFLNKNAIKYINENLNQSEVYFEILLNNNKYKCNDDLMRKTISKFELVFIFNEYQSKFTEAINLISDLSLFRKIKGIIETKFTQKKESKMRKFCKGYFSMLLFSFILKKNTSSFIHTVISLLTVEEFEYGINSIGFIKELRCFELKELYEILEILPKRENNTIELKSQTISSLISLLYNDTELLLLIFKEYASLVPYLSVELKSGYEENNINYDIAINIGPIFEIINLNEIEVVNQLLDFLSNFYFKEENQSNILFAFDCFQTFKTLINNTKTIQTLQLIHDCYKKNKLIIEESNQLGDSIDSKINQLLIKLMNNENQLYETEEYINSLLSFYTNYRNKISSFFKNKDYQQKLITNLSLFSFDTFPRIKDKLLQLELYNLFEDQAYIQYCVTILQKCSKIEHLYCVIELFFHKLKSEYVSCEILKSIIEELWSMIFNSNIYKEVPITQFNKLYNTILQNVNEFPKEIRKLGLIYLNEKMNEWHIDHLLILTIDEMHNNNSDMDYLNFLIVKLSTRLKNININTNKSSTAITMILKILQNNQDYKRNIKLTNVTKEESQLITIVLDNISLSIPQESDLINSQMSSYEKPIIIFFKKGLLLLPELTNITFFKNTKGFYTNIYDKWFANQLISIESLCLFAQLEEKLRSNRIELICMNNNDTNAFLSFIIEQYKHVSEFKDRINTIKTIIPDLFRNCDIKNINASIEDLEMILRSGILIDLNDALNQPNIVFLKDSFYSSIKEYELLLESSIFKLMISNNHNSKENKDIQKQVKEQKEQDIINERLEYIKQSVEEYKGLSVLFTSLDENIVHQVFNTVNIENELKILAKVTQNEESVNIAELSIKIKSILNFKKYNLVIENINKAFILFDIPPGKINDLLNQIKEASKKASNEKSLNMIFELQNNHQDLFEDPLKTIFEDLSSCGPLLSFFDNKTVLQLKNYYESIEINSELQIEDIVYLIIIFNFFETIKSSKNADEFINNIKTIISSNPNRGAQLNKILKNTNLFEEFSNKIEKKEEYSKNSIVQFLEASFVMFEVKDYDIEVSFRDGKDFNKLLISSEEELIEYSARSILLSKKKNDADEKQRDIMKKYEIFSIIIENIQQSKELILENNNLGCQINDKIIYHILDNEIYKVEVVVDPFRNVTYKYQDFIIYLRTNIEEMTNQTNEAYKIFPLLTYFHTNQFRILNKYIRFTKEFEEVKQLISYLTNQINIINYEAHKVMDNRLIDEDMEKEDLQDMFLNINSYIEKLFEINNISFEDIFKDLICDDSEIPGIYLVQQNIQPELLVVTILNTILKNKQADVVKIKDLNEFNLFTDGQDIIDNDTDNKCHFPIANIVFICSYETSKEEIIAFIYRWLNMTLKIPFFIINFSSVKIKIKNEIIKFLQEKRNKVVQSLLIFILSDIKENAFNVKTLDKVQVRNFPNVEYRNIASNKSNIEIIKSNYSGTGKTYAIRNYASEMKYRYIEFPISFDCSIYKIINRLKQINFDQPKILLNVLFLNDSYKNKDINQITFSFLITRCFSYKDKLYCLPEKIKLVVELPNGFVDIEEKCLLFQLFRATTINGNKLPKFYLNQEFDSKLNLICEYIIQDRKGLLQKNSILPVNFDFESYLFKLGGNRVVIKQYSPEIQKQIILSCFPNEHPTYYQLHSFIMLLSSQLELFSNSVFIHPVTLNEKSSNYLQMRHVLFNNLIKLAKFCTVPAYKNLIQNQNMVSQVISNKEDEDQKAINLFENQDIITFDKLPSGIIVFNKDGQSLKIITGSKNCTQQDLVNFQQLWNTQDKKRELINYRTIKQDQYYQEVLEYFDLKIQTNQKYLDIIKIPAGYVFTCDNFIKMILIHLRADNIIPVIIMGETGCGKTFLIKMITEISDIHLEILNMHAGISEDDVIKFMNEKVINYAKTKKIWVFFDEINTSQSMGLISDMICNRMMEGTPLDPKIIFIAACNPYRKCSAKRKEYHGLIYEKKYLKKNLVYNVLPLPHSLMNYVFDFGNLTANDEKRYIEAIVAQVINTNDKILKIATDLLELSLNYVRRKNEVSSVSLRDVKRFTIFYSWFMESIRIRIKLESKNTIYFNKKEDELMIYAIILSIYICFILRLEEKTSNLPEDLISQLANIVKKNKEFHIQSKYDLTNIILKEQFDITKRLVMPKEVALNNALIENTFALFTCINNQVPILICGKPGCSKTLSMEILNKSLLGLKANDIYLQSLPSLVIINYQGSQNSTSESIKNAFNKARKCKADMKNKYTSEDNVNKYSNTQDIALLFFDEMGLAEISENNPLKVLHSELEYDEKSEDKIAFVGLSNWNLDASKQNRCVFISRPDPDKNDLIKTAKIIAASINSNPRDDLYKTLVEAYFEYKNILKEKNKKIEDFHGLRDFYSLIKQISREIVQLDKIPTKKEIQDISKNALERNFSGLKINPADHIANKYLQNSEEYDIKRCIVDNIKDLNSRYLLLLSKSSISSHVLVNILEKEKTEYYFFLGSFFKNDLEHNEYIYKIINQILILIEQGKFVIMKNLERLYPSLYDLFNQHFTKYGDKNYAKVSVGMANNPNILVNSKFRCAILLDEGDDLYQDPPFLNRFEKQQISFDILTKNFRKDIPDDIKNKLNQLTNIKDTYKTTIAIKHQLINSDIEEISGLVYQQIPNPDDEIDKANVSLLVMEKLLSTFSQDIIMCSKFSEFNHPSNFMLLENLYKKYQANYCYSLCDYIKKTNNQKNLIYTFSSVYETIIIDKEINCFGFEVSQKTITELFISEFNSIYEIERKINDFYKSSSLNTLIIRFSIADTMHLNLIRHSIDNISKDPLNKDFKKLFILIVHVKRQFINDQNEYQNILPQYCISHLTEYNHQFIDNLLNENTLSIVDIMNDQYEKYDHLCLDYINIHLEEIIIEIYSKIHFVINESEVFDQIEYSDQIKNLIASNALIKEKIMSYLLQFIRSKKNLFENFFISNVVLERDLDLVTRFIENVIQLTNEHLNKIIIIIEMNGGFKPFFNMNELSEKKKNQYLKTMDLIIKNANFDQIYVNQGKVSNCIRKTIHLKIPSGVIIFDQITVICQNKSKNNIDNDNELRYICEDDEQKKYDFERNYKSIIDEVKEHINKILNDYNYSLKQDDNNEGIQYDFIDEYITYFSSIKEVDKSFVSLINKLLNKNSRYKNNFAEIVLWLNSYYDSFIKVFNYDYIEMKKYFDALDQIILDHLTDDPEVYVSSKYSPECKRKVNEVIFLLNESLIFQSLQDFSQDKGGKYFELIKRIYNNALQYEEDFNLRSKEIGGLESFFEIERILKDPSFKPIYNEDINQFIKFKNEEISLFKSKQIDLLIAKIKEELNFYSKYKDKENYAFFIMQIINSKYKTIDNEDFRRTILNYICSNTSYIIEAKDLFQMVLNNYDLSLPQEPDKKLGNFANQYSQLLSELNAKSNSYSDIILMQIFEETIQECMQEYINDINEDLYESYLSFFCDALEKVKSKKLNNASNLLHSNLALLYYIAYIKVFLFYSTKIFSDKTLYPRIVKSAELINAIKESNVKAVEFYFWKCLKYHLNNVPCRFATYEFDYYSFIEPEKDDNVSNKGCPVNYIKMTSDINFILKDDNEVSSELDAKFNNIFRKGFTQIETESLIEYANKADTEMANLFNWIANNFFFFLFSKNDDDRKINFYNWMSKSLLQKISLTQRARQIFDIIIKNDKNYFPTDVTEINLNLYFYSFKAAFMCLNSKQDNLCNDLYDRDWNYLNYYNKKKEKTKDNTERKEYLSTLLVGFIHGSISLIKNMHDGVEKGVIDVLLLNIHEVILSIERIIAYFEIKNAFMFLSMSFPFLNKAILNYTNLELESKLIEVDIISQLTPQYVNNYKEFNYRTREQTIKSCQTIVNEYEEPDCYKDLIPLYHYFMFTEYSSLNDYREIIKRNEDDFPILSLYFNADETKLNKLQGLWMMNGLISWIYKKFDGKLTREKAKNIKLDNVAQENEKNIELFQKGYELFTGNKIENIKDKNLYWFIIDKKDKDNTEKYAMYQEGISIQNGIIRNIAQLNHDYIINPHLEVDIIDADEKNVFLHSDEIEQEIKNYFLTNSYRIFCINGKLNYALYKKLQYNHDKIEKKFAQYYLENKRVFKTTLPQFQFGFEINDDNQMNWMTAFTTKHKQVDLSQNDIAIIDNFALRNEIDSIVSLLQSLIFNIKDKKVENHTEIIKAIEMAPKDLKIENDINFISFFRTNPIKVEQIVSIYEYLEEKYFAKLSENVNSNYKNECQSKAKAWNCIKNTSKDTKSMLIGSLRKFILRSLTGFVTFENRNPNDNIIFVLQNNLDLVNEKQMKNEEFVKAINDIDKMNIVSSQAYNLYLHFISEIESEGKKNNNMTKILRKPPGGKNKKMI